MSKPQSVRLTDDMKKRLAKEANKSDVINLALQQYYDMKDKGVRPPTHEEVQAMPEPTVVEPRIGRSSKQNGETGFLLPVGDVIMYGVYKALNGQSPLFRDTPAPGYEHMASTQLWWCPKEKIKTVEKLAQPWCDNGFSFHIGKDHTGSWLMPETILEKEQERGINRRFTANCRMQGALMGDRFVWLEIDDVKKAFNYLQSHSDLPCVVRTDIIEYGQSQLYKDVTDLCRDYFIYYWKHGTPKVLDHTTLSTKDRLEMMYDL